MACILIDAHVYGRTDKRPELPKEPLCMPVKTRRTLIWIKVLLLAAAFGVLIPVTMYMEKGWRPGGAPSQANAEQRQTSKKASALPSLFLWMTVFLGFGYVFNNIEGKAYAKLQNPMLNPQKFKYQGRLLSSDEPHYLLHLNYYRAHKTWTLPDEIEQSGLCAYENDDYEKWEFAADQEFFSSLTDS